MASGYGWRARCAGDHWRGGGLPPVSLSVSLARLKRIHSSILSSIVRCKGLGSCPCGRLELDVPGTNYCTPYPPLLPCPLPLTSSPSAPPLLYRKPRIASPRGALDPSGPQQAVSTGVRVAVLPRGVVCRPLRAFSGRQRGRACSPCLRGEEESPGRSCQGRRMIRVVAAIKVQRTISELCTVTTMTTTAMAMAMATVTAGGGHRRATGAKEVAEAAAAAVTTTNAATMRAKEVAGGQGRWQTQRRITLRHSMPPIGGRRQHKKRRFQVFLSRVLSRHRAVGPRALGLSRNAPSTASRQTLASRTEAAMTAMEGCPIRGRRKTETDCRSTTATVHRMRIKTPSTKKPVLRVPMLLRLQRAVRGGTAPGPPAHAMGCQLRGGRRELWVVGAWKEGKPKPGR